MMYALAKRSLFVSLAVSILAVSACSDDALPSDDVTCNQGERHNPITDLCEVIRTEEPPQNDVGTDTDIDENSDIEEDPADSGTDPSDTGQDSGQHDIDNPPEPTCYGNENGQVDPSLSCTFYAHTPDKLYLVDPYKKTAQEVMDLPANTFDIDTHPNGTLYAIAESKLYSLPPGAGGWHVNPNPINSGNPNGLCLDMIGKAFITSYSNLHSVELTSGQISSPIGGTDKLKPYSSSGDCVINKGDILFMSSKSVNPLISTDDLIQIDSANGNTNRIGNIGFSEVYALTAAWGRLFGLTGKGQVIEINQQTGQGTLLHTFPGRSWYGAASTPER